MSRTIKTVIETAQPNVFVEVATTHNKDSKEFRHSTIRVKRKGYMTEYRPMQDAKPSYRVSVARFSQKALENEHANFMRSVDRTELALWGAEFEDSDLRF